ncbi:hypothetical protein Droror1_Dr00004208 [Drosera rotundifolia]
MAGGQVVEKEEKVSLELTEEIIQSMKVGLVFRDYSGRISSMDFHKASSYLVTASDDESIRLYDVANATYVQLQPCAFHLFKSIVFAFRTTGEEVVVDEEGIE